MSDYQLTGLYQYPLKSARGLPLTEAALDRFGLAGDRRWMLVDEAGRFLSQRNLESLALLGAVATEQGLRLRWQEQELELDRPEVGGECVIARVWNDSVVAPVADAAVNAWLSERLGRPVRLVHCPDNALRGVDEDYAPPEQLVAFADGFPLLIVGQSSLDQLNERLEQPVPMDRFRPNLVISGAAPHGEDGWRRLRVGECELEIVKPCSRCAIPSIDQATAQRDPHINRTLAAYRRRDGVIYFGMNAVIRSGSVLHRGDAVEVLH